MQWHLRVLAAFSPVQSDPCSKQLKNHPMAGVGENLHKDVWIGYSCRVWLHSIVLGRGNSPECSGEANRTLHGGSWHSSVPDTNWDTEILRWARAHQFGCSAYDCLWGKYHAVLALMEWQVPNHSLCAWILYSNWYLVFAASDLLQVNAQPLSSNSCVY